MSLSQYLNFTFVLKDKETDREKERERQIDRQTDRDTERHRDIETDRKIPNQIRY